MRGKIRGERVKCICFPVFANYTVRVVLTPDVAKSRSARDSEIGNKYDGGDPLGIHAFNGNGDAWIFLPLTVEPGTVAHECFHCINRMMQWIQADLENEVVAYHLGFLVTEVSNFLRRCRQ